MDNHTFIGNIFKESCIELFEFYQCHVTEAYESVDEKSVFTALIDGGSMDVDLVIILKMPFSILALTYPVPNIIQVSEQELEDWIMEILNMLMGKVKGRLLKCNSDLQLGLPESFYGIDLSDVKPRRAERYQTNFYLDDELIECNLFYRFFDDNFNLASQFQEDVNVMDEGEVELF